MNGYQGPFQMWKNSYQLLAASMRNPRKKEKSIQEKYILTRSFATFKQFCPQMCFKKRCCAVWGRQNTDQNAERDKTRSVTKTGA